jgi:hypothetical protein
MRLGNYSFFQGENLKIKNSHPVLQRTGILERVCAVLKIVSVQLEQH